MKTIIVLAALALTGCATGNEAMLQALQNLEHCDRSYTAAIGMGAGGTLTINCKAKPY